MSNLFKSLFRRLPLSRNLRAIIREFLVDLLAFSPQTSGPRNVRGEIREPARSRQGPEIPDRVAVPENWRCNPASPLVIVRVGIRQEFTQAVLQRLLDTNAAGEDFHICVLTLWPVGQRLRRDLKQLVAAKPAAWRRTLPGLLKLIADHPGRDLVILHDTCLLPEGWGSRLRSISIQPDVGIATVSPLMTGSGATGYPLQNGPDDPELEVDWPILDRLASGTEVTRQSGPIHLPHASGPCVYVTREWFESLGKWQAISLFLGLPVSNGAHLLSPQVIVRKCASPAVTRKRRQAIEPQRNFPAVCLSLDLARIRLAARNRAVLFVTHGLGGGTELHVTDMARQLEKEGVSVFFLRPVGKGGTSVRLESLGMGQMSVLSRLQLPSDAGILAAALQELGISFAHIHHLAGFSTTGIELLMQFMRKVGFPYDLTLHDHTAICPRILLLDGNGRYCGEPDAAGCRICISRNGSDFGQVDIAEWRAVWATIFEGARNIYVPSLDLKNRINRYFPAIRPLFRSHPVLARDRALVAACHPRALDEQPSEGRLRRIAILGALVGHKGFDVVLRCAADAQIRRLPLEFVVIGFTADDHAASRAGIRLTGAFEPQDLPTLILRERPSAVLFASIVPETYSYTLSTVFALGLMPVAFDTGAIAERLRNAGRGHLLPLSLVDNPAEINDRLLTLPETCYAPFAEEAGFYPDLEWRYYGGIP